ncbi:acyl-CoA dehydrogenase family protein [Streptomyces jumonjinensis]|uniref:acyl-CoA dehydrogenase family protein n=1 Tax=Streptomyces jumonjinensis TaxID=1945 RepID=UPI0037BC3918
MYAYFGSESHEHLRKVVGEFARNEVAPLIPRMEAERSVQRELSRRIAAQGWLGVTVDRAYGGMGAGHVAKTVVIEELSRVSGAMGAVVQASQLGVAKIVHFGNERQKRRWLPLVAAGDCLPTIAVTETASGGHLLGMEATGRREGEEYVLNGRKVFVGNSHVGDLHGVVVRTGPEPKNLSAFLVESSRPGLSLGAHRPAMGLHGFSFGELVFEECRVPAGNLLGEEGDGLAVALSSSTLYGRPNLTAVAYGIHRAIVEETVAFTRRRQRYGGPLSGLDTVRQKLGQMQSQLMIARLAAYHAVHLLDAGLPCDAELMNAKLVNVESSLDSARLAMEVHAAAGLFPDLPIERLLRDAFHIFAPAGTSDVQRLRLAEVALGARKGREWSAWLASREEEPVAG